MNFRQLSVWFWEREVVGLISGCDFPKLLKMLVAGSRSVLRLGAAGVK